MSVGGRLCKRADLRRRVPGPAFLIVAGSSCALAACNILEDRSMRLVDEPIVAAIQGGAKGRAVTSGPIAHTAVQPAPMTVAIQQRNTSGRQPDAFAAAAVPSSEADATADELLQYAKQRLASLVHRGLMTTLYPDQTSSSPREPTEQFFVQIGSYEMEFAADAQLDVARSRFAGLLSNLDMRVRSITLAPQRRLFRVQIGPMKTQSAARDLCRAFKSQNQECFTLAAAPVGENIRAQLDSSWASIGVGEEYSRSSTPPPVPPPRASQMADASPLFTVPGLPGVSD